MTPAEFIAKWSRNTRNERAASQEHFLDLCALLSHPTPNSDASGEDFAFEKGVTRRRAAGNGQGWADVWKRAHFGWEYKGKHKDLEAAHKQLQQYAQDLENPPLLVVCDMQTLVVHTNFNNAPKERVTLDLNAIDDTRVLARLRQVFFEPERFRPQETIEEITERAAEQFGLVANAMFRRGLEPLHVVRFLNRVVFCLFAEDIGLLPRQLFSGIVEANRANPQRLQRRIEQLFRVMTHGGDFDEHEIRRFNGNLFNDEDALLFEQKEIDIVRAACGFDWNALSPSIMGTLFESALDESQERAQLGAHYTKQSDIESLVKPVVMAPLENEWRQIRERLEALPATENHVASKEINAFLARLGALRVLDPACGSGNFLYVALQLLKDLEKSVHRFATDRGLGEFSTVVRPEQFIGLEINANAMDLAQTTLWIGFLQWTFNNGYPFPDDPLLHNTDNFRNVDAILDRSDAENPCEREWPQVDFLVGNPPFLGDKMMRRELGDEYVNTLREIYENRIPGQSDFCCYWFEKARAHIENRRAQRAGLIATQGIRGGANRRVLARIKESGDIFYAVSDRDWVLKGANVHVSLVGFDDGTQTVRVLDEHEVAVINADLSGATDLSKAAMLADNKNLGFVGVAQKAPFDISEEHALSWLNYPNPHGLPNSDVLRPICNASDITQRSRKFWNVDFGLDMKEHDAALYEQPFEHIYKTVRPLRIEHREARQVRYWWLFARPCPDMRKALYNLPRYLATPRVSKHRVFSWLSPEVLCDSAVVTFARDDDYFFGVLHSRLHEVWALKLGTQLEDRPRYTPTSCFETFAFPQPNEEQRAAISEAARVLAQLRENWLNPPEWMREEVLEFRGSVNGAWRRFVVDADANGIGTVRYPRLVPRDLEMTVPIVRDGITSAARLRDELPRRTLTNLYNARPAWLCNAHRNLDAAVCDAYGFPHDLEDDEILARLLALNAERAS